MKFSSKPLDGALQGSFFHSAPDTALSRMLQATLVFIDEYPHLLVAIDKDLDQYGREMKAIRLEEAREHLLIHDNLPGIPEFYDPYEPSKLKLASTGRKRIPLRMLMVYYVLRGLLGGSKGSWVSMLQGESRSLEILKTNYGWPNLKASAIEANLNAIGVETREEIHRCLLDWIEKQEIDDLQLLMLDSTAVEANSSWPTDSGILEMLVRQCLGKGEKLQRRREKEDWIAADAKELLRQVKNENFTINCQKGKKGEKSKKIAEEVRRTSYGVILETAEYVSQWYGEKLAKSKMETSRKWKRQERKIWEELQEKVERLDGQIEATYRRLSEEKGDAERKRTYSADPDARMIVKGGREPVIGYKPQAAVSEKGFVLAVETFLGNVADSQAIKPILNLYKMYTGKEKPRQVSVDDGYTSRENLEYLQEIGVEEISFSGSKGKKILKEKYMEPALQRLRKKRSHVEAVIFQLKDLVGFGRMRRKGLDKVRMEMMEKVAAFNLWRIQMIM